MPEMVLIMTDLPAPLSPANAVTWPAGMSRSTSVSAFTGPNVPALLAWRSSPMRPLALRAWAFGCSRTFAPCSLRPTPNTSLLRPLSPASSVWRSQHGRTSEAKPSTPAACPDAWRGIRSHRKRCGSVTELPKDTTGPTSLMCGLDTCQMLRMLRMLRTESLTGGPTSSQMLRLQRMHLYIVQSVKQALTREYCARKIRPGCHSLQAQHPQHRNTRTSSACPTVHQYTTIPCLPTMD